MDSIMEKLSEIEHTAASIVENAEAQKTMLEQEYQKKRKQFDDGLELATKSKILKIRSELETHTSALLREQAENIERSAGLLKQEYEEKHTIYANEILKRITNTEV